MKDLNNKIDEDHLVDNQNDLKTEPADLDTEQPLATVTGLPVSEIVHKQNLSRPKRKSSHKTVPKTNTPDAKSAGNKSIAEGVSHPGLESGSVDVNEIETIDDDNKKEIKSTRKKVRKNPPRKENSESAENEKSEGEQIIQSGLDLDSGKETVKKKKDKKPDSDKKNAKKAEAKVVKLKKQVKKAKKKEVKKSKLKDLKNKLLKALKKLKNKNNKLKKQK